MLVRLRVNGEEYDLEENSFEFHFIKGIGKKAEQEGISTKEYMRLGFTGMLMTAEDSRLQHICRESLASNQSGSFRAIKEE